MRKENKAGFKKDVDYQGYLNIDKLLSARETFTDSLAEHTFIMVHQAAELYIDDTNRHLNTVKTALKADDVGWACEALHIVVTNILYGWMAPWTRLLEMRPRDFQRVVRPHLGSASGFQSLGHRIFEFHQGDKRVPVSDRGLESARYDELVRLKDEPSVYDETIALLHRRGFVIDAGHLDRDVSQCYQANASVEAAWRKIYMESERFRDLYNIGECLIDIDHHFQIWRFCHMKTVQRHIGRKIGTYGTSGVDYLVSIIDREFYPEIWSVRRLLDTAVA